MLEVLAAAAAAKSSAQNQDCCRERIVHRAQQLKEAQVEIQVFNITPEGQQFDMKPLWRDVVFTTEGETRSTEAEPLRIQVTSPLNLDA